DHLSIVALFCCCRRAASAAPFQPPSRLPAVEQNVDSWRSRSVKIRRLEPYEIALHRDIRLRALRDAPDSFAETAAEAEARPASYWEELTRSVTEPGRHVMFLACEGDAIHGSTYGLRDPENGDAGRVGGTWVAASRRRQGVGKALLQAVFFWARERG